MMFSTTTAGSGDTFTVSGTSSSSDVVYSVPCCCPSRVHEKGCFLRREQAGEERKKKRQKYDHSKFSKMKWQRC